MVWSRPRSTPICRSHLPARMPTAMSARSENDNRLLPTSNSTTPPTCCFEGTRPTATRRVKLVICQNHCGCILVAHGCYMAGNQQSWRMVGRSTGRFVAFVHDKLSEISELEIKYKKFPRNISLNSDKPAVSCYSQGELTSNLKR